MSSSVVSSLIAIPMLLHGLFGCCWHHVDCLRSHDHIAGAHSEHCHEVCGCRHSHDDHDQCESDFGDEFTHESESETDVALAECNDSLPQPTHSCTGSRCDYLTSSRVRTTDPGLHASPSNPSAVLLSSAIRTNFRPALTTLALPAADAGTGQLRAHVLCCVWLI